MTAKFRKIVVADVNALFAVRCSVRENPFSVAELAAKGITPQATRHALGCSLEGFVSEVDDRLVGFAMADTKTGELSVIAVLHDYERRGIGRELLLLAEALLWSAGHTYIWLWTGNDRSTRALRLYHAAGWTKTESREDRIYMKKTRPNQALEPTITAVTPAANAPAAPTVDLAHLKR